MRMIVAGTGLLAAGIMRSLFDSAHEVVGLIQNGRSVRGLDRRIYGLNARLFHGDDSPVRLAALARIPLLWIDKMTPAELAPIRELKPDLILTSGFGVILKKPLLELPSIGCVNVHSSLLPRHRGPNPFGAAILAGDTESGVTFHAMDEGIDTGAILAQYPFPVGARDTAFDVYRAACKISRERAVEVCDRIAREGLHGTPQDPAAATYEKLLNPFEVDIDWTRAAEEIDRLIRGAGPFLNARFLHRGRKVLAISSDFSMTPVSDAPGTVLSVGEGIRVATGRGSVTILAARMDTASFKRWPHWNRPVRAGDRLE